MSEHDAALVGYFLAVVAEVQPLVLGGGIEIDGVGCCLSIHIRMQMKQPHYLSACNESMEAIGLVF